MKRPGLWIIVLTLCLLVASSAFAKKGDDEGATVLGTVMAPVKVKPDSGQVPIAPVEGCTIVLQQNGQTMYQAVSGPTGSFTIEKVKAGDYTLVAERPHLGSATQTLHVIGGGQMARPSVMLTLEARFNRPVKSEEVCVAYAAPQASGSGTTGQTIPGPPLVSNSYRAGIAAGADPFQLNGNAPLPSIDPRQYTTAVSMAPNSVMVLDPEDPQHAQFTELNARPYWLCLNAAGTKIYVSTDQQTINVYNASNHEQLTSIPTGGIVTDVVLSPDGNWVFASVIAGTPGILVIDPKTDTPVRFVNTPKLSSGERGLPMSIAVNSDNSRLYTVMGTPHNGEVIAIDSQTMRVLGRGKVGPQPLGVGISPDGRLLFVANGGNATVSVIDTTTMTQIGVVSVGVTPTRVAVRPDGGKVYVTCKGSDSVYVITNASGTATKIAVGHHPMGIAVTSSGHRVYVANNGSGNVTIINGDKDIAEKETTPLPSSQPYGVTVNR